MSFPRPRRGDRSVRRKLLHALGLMIVVALATAPAGAQTRSSRDHDDDRDDDDGLGPARDLFHRALSDQPYRRRRRAAGVPDLIADMNRQDLAFTVHDGDLKAGLGQPLRRRLCMRGRWAGSTR